MSSDSQLTEWATNLANRFSEPEFRFDSIQVRVSSLATVDENAILALELGDVVKVTFTPSNIPPAISKYAEIIRINQEIDTDGEHIITFGFATIDYVGWLLGTEAFGRLDFITTI
jgi:hypothetical protein